MCFVRLKQLDSSKNIISIHLSNNLGERTTDMWYVVFMMLQGFIVLVGFLIVVVSDCKDIQKKTWVNLSSHSDLRETQSDLSGYKIR